MKRKRTTAIVVHHSVSPRDTTTLAEINAWHKEKGLTDAYGNCGYHFFIPANGDLMMGRPIDDWGCQVKNWNDRSVGVCLAGNFNQEQPTEAQINTLVECLVKACRKYNLKYWNIYGHRDIKWLFFFNTTQTACPGDNLYARLKEIRLRVKGLLGQ
jgi:hypothetical protein